jgi:hypothetical protein
MTSDLGSDAEGLVSGMQDTSPELCRPLADLRIVELRRLHVAPDV